MRRTSAAVMILLTVSATHSARAQDAQNGEQVFKKCMACHRVGPGAKNLVGPELNGIVGRKAGTVEGFSYSSANKEAGAKGVTWTDETLDKYLADPHAFMPGTKMAFAGLPEESDRKDLIAYLKQFK